VRNVSCWLFFLQIRDTSVFVRLRPAWEDLRSYLTAKGRKRFEVYVCTMAERDYALEMWRLLDPEAHLISSSQLLGRVVCVKPGKDFDLLICLLFPPKTVKEMSNRLEKYGDHVHIQLLHQCIVFACNSFLFCSVYLAFHHHVLQV